MHYLLFYELVETTGTPCEFRNATSRWRGACDRGELSWRERWRILPTAILVEAIRPRSRRIRQGRSYVPTDW